MGRWVVVGGRLGDHLLLLALCEEGNDQFPESLWSFDTDEPLSAAIGGRVCPEGPREGLRSQGVGLIVAIIRKGERELNERRRRRWW